MEEQIKIMIVDDMEAHRRRFRRILSCQEDMNVIAEASSGREAVALTKDVRPHIILMDIEMESRTAGIDASREILAEFPDTKIIILTVHKDDNAIFQAYQAGISDYIFKTEDPDIVVSGIRMAYNSASPIRGDVAQSIRSEFKRIKESESSLLYVLGILPTLTYSELQVLKLLCENKTRREIAEERVVEYDTVKKQIGSILKKFGKSSTAEVVELFRQLNIIKLLR
ncbi:MAG: response regulator transcription factor [Hungatella hathewayi]|nr:response regulator transcription factor [Hungatella hathewayi]